MGRFDIQRCYNCGKNEFEDNMLEYNDHFYCGIRCKIIKERESNETLDDLDNVVPYRPVICNEH